MVSLIEIGLHNTVQPSHYPECMGWQFEGHYTYVHAYVHIYVCIHISNHLAMTFFKLTGNNVRRHC